MYVRTIYERFQIFHLTDILERRCLLPHAIQNLLVETPAYIRILGKVKHGGRERRRDLCDVLIMATRMIRMARFVPCHARRAGCS